MVTARRTLAGAVGLFGMLWCETGHRPATRVEAAEALKAPVLGVQPQPAHVRPEVMRLPAQTMHAQAPAAAGASAAQTTLLARYCVTCHNEKLKTAGLMLDKVDTARVGESPAVFEKVLRKLQSRAMPPPGLPRPDAASYASLAAHLEKELDRAAAAHPNPGRPGIRRLNRTEYANAIRDLLAVEIDGTALLPAETLAYGFDNIGGVLSMSPGLFERYLSAAQRISRMAVGDVTVVPGIQSYRPTVYGGASKVLQDRDRVSEAVPFGSRGGFVVKHHFPVEGEYGIRVSLGRILWHEQQLDIRIDGERVALLPLEVNGAGMFDSDLTDEVRFKAGAGTRTLAVTFVKTTAAYEGLDPLRRPGWGINSGGSGTPPLGEVIRIDLGGPYTVVGPGDTPSRRQIFACRPATASEEAPCAQKILSGLARRAYRRPVTPSDLQPLLHLYGAARAEGQAFDVGIQQAIAGLLVTPDFLLRTEYEPAGVAPGTAYRLSDIELASRLSFFLWSTIPDDALLSAAERGSLKDPAVLEQQVRRMLADARADTLVRSFATQWLQLQNLQQVQPNFIRFPEWDDSLRESMHRETELFLTSQFREDRPVTELLSANYSFINERLARHYGIPGIYGSHFRRVTLTDERRFGLLGQGSVLTITSYAHRTSPVLRGKWLLETILDAPPPPPPPNVPLLKEDDGEGAVPSSLRERMEQHRKDPGCAVCHKGMDPLGFALENFDAVGRFRALDGGTAIDPSGELADGTKVDGPVGLRGVLLDRRDEFVTAVTSKLLTYALGRGLEYYDAPVIRQIRREAAATDDRWSALVLGIVKSTPFQMRTADAAPATDKEASR